MKIIIKGGRVVDPANKIDENLDILIENGKILKLSKYINIDEARYIDASKKIVSPGFIDTDCNFYNIETIKNESNSALAGGFTTVAIMPDTLPVIDNKKAAMKVLEKAEKDSLINLFIIGAITKDLLGQELSFMEELNNIGVVAFSDNKPIENTEILRIAFQYAKRFEKNFLVNCEDTFLIENGLVNEGFISTVLGLKGRPKIAETIMIYRDVLLAIESDVPIHILNTTCNYSIEAVRHLKTKYKKLTAGVNQDYFVLSEEACLNFNTNAKLQPPLRNKGDVMAVKEGLKNDTIDVISSGHRPKTLEEKNKVFRESAFGNSGIELTLALVVTELVKTGYLDISNAISKLTINPAKLLKINKGMLNIGTDADIVIFDINKKWIVKENKLFSNSKNTPYINKELYGTVEKVIIGGEEVFDIEKKFNNK